MNNRVVFATPTLDHRVCVEYLRSYVETLGLLGVNGVPFAHVYVGGDQFIAKARNLLVTKFLRDHPQATDLFFLDDDVGWPAAKVIEFLCREEDVVAGAYPQKCAGEFYPCTLVPDAAGKLVERHGLYQAQLAPTGFMRIKRPVLERLAEQSTTYLHRNPDGTEERHYAIFEAGVHHESGEFWGEDYYFCRRWAEAGGEIWLDPDVSFTHRGNQVWRGTFRDVLNKRG